MKRKIIWLLVSSLVVLSLVLASCGGEEEEEEVTVPTEEEEVVIPTEEEEEVVPPAGGNWWDYHGEPEYGGTLTWRLVTDITSWDPWRSSDFTGLRAMYEEGWFGMNWTTDRKILPLKGGFGDPNEQFPLIVESWEIPDNFITFIVNIRQGVTWQNKPPVNGRELTAYDIEYYWHRMVGGMGSGFEAGSNPYTYFKGWDDFKSIEATDKYTVVFTLKYSVAGIWTMLWGPGNAPFAREVVEQYGDCADWKNAVGTGAFLLKDYVAGSSATFEKNPTYWGWDQRHSDKSIPYIDSVKFLIIPDQSTAFAALRTGKISMMTGVNWEQAEAFEQTNPDLKQVPILGTGYSVAMRVDKEPFTDINVRKALNMAIDHKTIAATYYGGRVEGKPVSYYNPNMGPYYTPFEEWPKEIQEGHTYNPAGARQVLAEAGYPNGFKTNFLVSTGDDMDLPIIIQDYFADIGVDMEIRPVEATQFFSFVNIFKKHDQMVWGMQGAAAAGGWLPQFSAKNIGGAGNNVCMIDDPALTEMIDREALYPFDSEGKISYNKQSDMYVMNLYLTVNTVPSLSYLLYQPWLKGYSGEMPTEFGVPVIPYFARWWIDSELKASMGQ